MKRLFLPALLVTIVSALAAFPAQAESDRGMNRINQVFPPTSNALPLLETTTIQGRITGIDGNRVQIVLPHGETHTYRVSQSRQQQNGLNVGSTLVLHVRRLNQAVIAISKVDHPLAEQ
ncbi:MAG TPA: hypothetical protein V6C65_14930 [Allocoleopsis sp.]